MNIHAFPAEMMAHEAAQDLNARCALCKGKDFLFLSSGGSSLALLDLIDISHFGPQSTVAVLDERYSIDPGVNNFAQLAKTDFYAKALKNGCHFIDTRPQKDESMENLAARFENALRQWVEKTHGTIIATVGVGLDAHTSGIMPYPEDATFFETAFNDEKQWVKGYNAREKSTYPLRVTVTLPFMRKIDHVVSFIKGADKKQAVEKLRANSGTLHESPCRILRELPHAEIFIEL